MIKNWLVRIPDKELGTLLLIVDYVRPYGWGASWLQAINHEGYHIIYFNHNGGHDSPTLSKDSYLKCGNFRISDYNEITWEQFCTNILNIKAEYEIY